MKVKMIDGKIRVESAYNPDLPAAAKRLGGKWESSSRAWIYDERDAERVEKLYLRIYGEWPMNGSAPAELCDVRVTINRDMEWAQESAFLFGRMIARAFDRDSGAKLGEGVVMVKGRFGSGGSRKNWTTAAKGGTIFEVRDLPKAIVDSEITHNDSDFTIEIVTNRIDRDALIKERQSIINRLAEINAIIGEEN